MDNISQIEPIVLTTAEACRLLKASRTAFEKERKLGNIPFIRIGRGYRYPIEELKKMVTRGNGSVR